MILSSLGQSGDSDITIPNCLYLEDATSTCNLVKSVVNALQEAKLECERVRGCELGASNRPLQPSQI